MNMNHFLKYVIPAATCALGYFLGNNSRYTKEPLIEGERINAMTTQSVVVNSPVQKEASKQDAATSEMVSYVQRAKALSSSAFGTRMAELMTATDSIATISERAAMIATMDGDRMAASYVAYKKKLGIGVNEHCQELRTLLVAAGQRDGLHAFTAMQSISPEFPEMSSLVHGWVLTDPNAVVQWFNAREDKAPGQALVGLIWGLGQKGGTLAKNAFQSLSPEDQSNSAYDLARSMTTTHGLKALDDLMVAVSPNLTQKLIDGALERINRRPPDEVVPWLAAKLETNPKLISQLKSALDKWVIADPTAAKQWQEQMSSKQPK